MKNGKLFPQNKLTASVAVFLILCMTASPVSAQIELAGVENGDVTVQQDGNQYNINASENAIANFTHFDIGADESVHFNLPSATSSMLNRVTGGTASEILGSLFSNGAIFLINSMGIHFGASAQVETQGLVASSLNISNQDFLAGNYALSNGLNAAGAGVSNEGNIRANDGGFIVLAGNTVANLGSLAAQGGTVALAAGNQVTLGLDQGNIISVLVNEPVKAPILDGKGQPVQDLVKQAGTISANGGQVFLSAKATEEIFDHVINHTGIIEAHSLINVDGKIILDGGEAGIVRVAGVLDASGLDKGAKGGTVQVYGDKVGVVERALLDVTGNKGGGIVLLGADYKGSNAAHPSSITSVGANAQIKADAMESGNGGRVIVWSEDATRYYGNISAQSAEGGQGGFAEISSHGDLTFNGNVDLTGPNGSAGTLLLDPSFLTITDMLDGAGTLDGELTPGTDAELLSSVPDDLVTNTVSRGQLEAFGPDANIILETSGLLRVSDMAGNAINLKATTGSLTLKAQSITFNDLNDVIRTEGGNITAQALLSQGRITGGGFDTTGILGNKSGNISLSANTDISVGNVKTGGGTFTANADFDQAGNFGTFSINSGALVSTNGGTASITASDVNLLGSLSAGDLNFSTSRSGTNINPANIGLGNASASFSLSGDELSRITASKMTVGGSNNDEITADGVTAAQSQNIGTLVLNAMKANRDLLFQGGASFFNALTLNTARDVISNAPVTVNGTLNIKADHDVVLNQHLDAFGDSVVHADQEANGSGDLIMAGTGGLLTHDHSLEVRADEIKFNSFSPLSSGTGAMKLLVSDGGNIQIGNGANDFYLDADSFKNITAGDLTIGDSTSGDLISNGLQDGDLAHVTGTVTLNATGTGHKIIFSGNGSNFPNKLYLNAADGIQADKNLKTQQELFINADSDKTGPGTFSTSAGVSVNTGSHAIQITAKDLDLAATSTVTSGASTTAILPSNGGTIGIGNTAGDMTISGAELQSLKANGLTIGDGTVSSILVDGVTSADVANVTNFLTLAATGPSSFINFLNGASSFNFLTANAGNGIQLNTNLAMTAGNFKANADSDANGTGTFSLASGSELSTVSANGVEITAADVDLAGNINTGRTGFVTLMPSLSSESIGLNDASGSFNLSALELNHLISTGPETPNVQVTIGRDGGTGHIDISSLGATTITPSYNMKLKGGDTFFHNRLSLATSQTLELATGAVTGSGVRDINFTGGLGTLILNTSGSVTLQTLMDRLGKSTVNGDLNLFDQVSLNLSGGAAGSLNVQGSLTLQSLRDINIDAPVTTFGTALLSADSDRNSSGNFVLGTNGSVTTNSHALQISSNDITLTAGSFLNSGTADTTLLVTDGGNIAVGQGAASDYTLNQNEIKLITAQNLVIGDSTSGNITVNGLNETQTATLGNTVFNATGAGKTVSFTGGASIFQNAVTANASSGVTLNKNLKTLSGNITINADTDAAGTGDFTIADGTSLNSSSHAIDITARDFNLNATGVIDSFQASTAVHSSQAGTLRVGNGTGDMTVSKSELSRMKASSLTLGGSKENIIVDSVAPADLALISGGVTLNATGLTGDVSFVNAPFSANALSVNAGRDINVQQNVSTLAGPLSLYADFDGNGTGDVNVSDGVAVSSGSNALDITAHHINLSSTATLSSGTGQLGIHNSDGGTLGFGAAAGDISVNDFMLDRITAGSLVLGGAGTKKISVDGLSALRTQPFSKVTLNALASHGSIEFMNGASTFNALDASANEGIAVNTPLVLDEGGLKADADFDKDGVGTFSVANGAGITVPAAKNVQISGANFDINADITGGDQTQFLISPSALNGSIGLNDAQGLLNLTAAELNRFVLSSGSGLLRIGTQGGTGNVYIGSLGAFSIAGLFNFELFGGTTNFSNLLTLQDNRSASLNTGTTTGSGGNDLAIGGAAGKLFLKTTGAVNLKTSVAELGASTVGGSLDLANDKDLNLSGAITTKNANGKVDLELANHTLTMLAGSTLNTGSGDIILTADEIDLNGGAGSVTGLGNLTLQPGTPSLSIGVAGGAGDLDISLTDLAAIHKNFAQMNIGRADGSGALTINTVSFVDPISFYSPAAGGAIYVNGTITGTDNASVTFFGSGGTTYLNAGITTSGDDIIIHDSVVLGANVTLATSLNGSGGGKIQIDGSINGPFNLTLKSGPAIDLKGPIGNTVPIGTGTGYALDLLTSSTGLSTLYGTLQANSGIRSQGPIKFMEDVTLAAGDTSSLFLGDAILDGLSFAAGGGVQFGDTASDDITLSSGPVSISTSNAAITFNGKMNGSQNLTLDSGTAATTFNADAGTVQRLGDSTGYAVNVKSQGMTTFQRLNLNSGILTAGPVTFLLNVLIAANGNASFLKGDTILSGLAFDADNGATFGDSASDLVHLEDGAVVVDTVNAPLIFNARVEGSQDFSTNTGTGQTDFYGNVGALEAMGDGVGLAFNSNSTGATLFHGTFSTLSGIKTTGTTTFQDNVSIGAGDKDTLFNGDIILDGLSLTAGRTVNFGNNSLDHVTLSGGPVSVTTLNNSKVTFFGTLDGSQNLTVDTGNAAVDFLGNVGNVNAVGSGTGSALTLNSLGLSTFNGTLKTNSGINAVGPVLFKEDVTVGAGNTGTKLNGNVTLDGLTFTYGTNTEFGDSALDAINFSAGPITFTSTNGANLVFHGTPNGAQDLTFNGGTGNLTFETAVTAPNFVHIYSAKDVNFNSTLQTPGDLIQSAGTGTTRFFDSVNAAAINVTTGAISFNGSGNLNAGSGAGTIVLTAQTGAISGGTSLTDLAAASLVASAAAGIGSLANPLLTAVSNLEAFGGTGGVYITNTGALIIGGISGMVGVSALSGDIQILTHSPLTGNEAVSQTGGGNITLAALGKTAADDLTLNANVTASGGHGNITAAAGDTLTLAPGVVVAASQNGTVKLASGEDFTDGLLNQDGNKGITGGDIVMAGNSAVQSADGDITVDSSRNLILGVINANSNGDKTAGNVNTFSRAGVTTDANGKDINITANKLVMISSGDIGAKADPIDLSSKTKINTPAYTSFPACSSASSCGSERYVKDVKDAKEVKVTKEIKETKEIKPKK